MEKVKIFWDLEKEEEWLNEMDEKGYEFIKRSGCNYKFKESKEKGKFCYCIDVKRKQDAGFAEFIEELNGKLVCRNLLLHYYQMPREDNVQMLYTDSKNKVLFYIRYIFFLLGIAGINVLILYNAGGPYILNISIPFVLNLIVLCIVVYAIAQSARNIISILYRE